MNFFGNDFAPEVTLACCNGGFIAQRRFPSEPMVAELTRLLLVVGPVRSPSSSSVPPSPYFYFSQFYFNFFLIWFIIIIIIIAIEFSLCGSSPYTSTDKTNKNKYT